MADLEHLMSNKRSSITLIDGSAVPHELTLDLDRSDFAVSGFGAGDGDHELVKVERKGELIGLLEDARVYPTISFTGVLKEFTSETAGNAVDFIRRTGSYSGNESTLGPGQPYAIDIVYKWTRYDGTVATWTFEDCIPTLNNFTEGVPSTVGFDAECLGEHVRE